MGMEDYKDITDVAVQEIGRVHSPILEAPNEEAATLAVAATQRLSTSTTPTRYGSRSLVATP